MGEAFGWLQPLLAFSTVVNKISRLRSLTFASLEMTMNGPPLGMTMNGPSLEMTMNGPPLGMTRNGLCHFDRVPSFVISTEPSRSLSFRPSEASGEIFGYWMGVANKISRLRSLTFASLEMTIHGFVISTGHFVPCHFDWRPLGRSGEIFCQPYIRSSPDSSLVISTERSEWRNLPSRHGAGDNLGIYRSQSCLRKHHVWVYMCEKLWKGFIHVLCNKPSWHQWKVALSY